VLEEVACSAFDECTNSYVSRDHEGHPLHVAHKSAATEKVNPPEISSYLVRLIPPCKQPFSRHMKPFDPMHEYGELPSYLCIATTSTGTITKELET
jgi:hypothetical protein